MSRHPVIPPEACVPGDIYLLRSRNLVLGAYDGRGGFIGIREKFGDRYLFTEYHRGDGTSPMGTASPVERVGHTDLPLVESYHVDGRYRKNEPLYRRLRDLERQLRRRIALTVNVMAFWPCECAHAIIDHDGRIGGPLRCTKCACTRAYRRARPWGDVPGDDPPPEAALVL